MSADATALSSMVHVHNRRVVGEALLTLGVGLASSILVFGGIYWLCFLSFTMCIRGIGFGGPWVLAGVVTSVFLSTAFWSAWRQSDPIAEATVEPDDPLRRAFGGLLAVTTDTQTGRRFALPGIGAMLIGGPATLLDAIEIWRTRLRYSVDVLDDAHILLQQCATGVTMSQVRSPNAVALLHRLKLIKAVLRPDGELSIQPTEKGVNVMAAFSLREPHDR